MKREFAVTRATGFPSLIDPASYPRASSEVYQFLSNPPDGVLMAVYWLQVFGVSSQQRSMIPAKLQDDRRCLLGPGKGEGVKH